MGKGTRTRENLMDLSNKSYSELVHLRALVNQAIAEQETTVVERLNKGEIVPNFRFKEGRMKRTVTNQGMLVQTLRDKGLSNEDLYEAKFVGIPALEKVLKAKLSQADAEKILKRHIEVSYGNPTLEYTGE